ncbi:MAG: DUF4838 domain-containing protein, partial [Phycisphaeraceae bacterium]
MILPGTLFPMLLFVALSLVAAIALPARAEPEILGAADLDPVTVHDTPKHDPVVLVADGEARGVIYAAKTSGMTSKLLQEMRDAIAATTGATLEIVRNAPDPDTPAIVVGDSDGSRAAGIDASGIPIEGFVIKTAPNRVFLVGSSDTAEQNANAWAIADFLERHVGVRWWWPLDHHGRTIEPAESLTIEPVHYEDAPAYRMRVGWPPFYNGTPHGTLRVSDLYDRLRGGNSWPIQLAVHQPRSGQWRGLYAEDRPEIFAERKDGSRNFGMFDYAHPKTLETFLENIELYKTATGEDRKTNEFKMKTSFIKGRAITVSPPDMGVHSESEYSQKLLEPEKGGFASASKLMGLFVRDLAQEVQKRYPDMVVLYLPYVNYTLAPEGIEFPDNVEAQLCGMPGVAMYKQPELNKQFQGNIDRWAELTARPIQTWDYSCWPTDRTKAPFQYPHVLKDYYQRNREQVVGTFINGGIPDEWIAQHFTMYCWMKLMWDPAFDVDAAADAFAQRMFGPAAEPIR